MAGKTAARLIQSYIGPDISHKLLSPVEDIQSISGYQYYSIRMAVWLFPDNPHPDIQHSGSLMNLMLAIVILLIIGQLYVAPVTLP